MYSMYLQYLPKSQVTPRCPPSHHTPTVARATHTTGRTRRKNARRARAAVPRRRRRHGLAVGSCGAAAGCSPAGAAGRGQLCRHRHATVEQMAGCSGRPDSPFQFSWRVQVLDWQATTALTILWPQAIELESVQGGDLALRRQERHHGHLARPDGASAQHHPDHGQVHPSQEGANRADFGPETTHFICRTLAAPPPLPPLKDSVCDLNPTFTMLNSWPGGANCQIHFEKWQSDRVVQVFFWGAPPTIMLSNLHRGSVVGSHVDKKSGSLVYEIRLAQKAVYDTSSQDTTKFTVEFEMKPPVRNSPTISCHDPWSPPPPPPPPPPSPKPAPPPPPPPPPSPPNPPSPKPPPPPPGHYPPAPPPPPPVQLRAEVPEPPSPEEGEDEGEDEGEEGEENIYDAAVAIAPPPPRPPPRGLTGIPLLDFLPPNVLAGLAGTAAAAPFLAYLFRQEAHTDGRARGGR